MPRRNPYADDAVRRYLAGEPLEMIVRDVSRTQLYRKLKQAGVARNRSTRLVDDALIVGDYQSGVSVAELSRRYEVSRQLVIDRLAAAGVPLRGRSEANRRLWETRTSAQRLNQVSSAHEAVRGRGRTWREKAFGALTTEYRRKLTEDESALCLRLEALGLAVHPQRALGVYNIDIAVPPVAVELFSRAPNAHTSVTPGLPKRLDYIFDHGWAIYVAWSAVPGADLAQDIFAFVQLARSEPAGGRRYRVVWGDGQFVTEGRCNGDYRPIVEATIAVQDASRLD